MKRRRKLSSGCRKAIIVFGIIGIVLAFPVCTVCACMGALLFLDYSSYWSFPSSETIARRYLAAVTTGDLEAAVELAGTDESCRLFMRQDAKRDIAMLNGTEIRNVEVVAGGGGGSDDEMGIAAVDFEYRVSVELEWQRGRIRLMTDHEWLSKRYACGNLMYHGP